MKNSTTNSLFLFLDGGYKLGKVLKSFNTCNISGFHILALKALLYPVYGLELRLHKQNQENPPHPCLRTYTQNSKFKHVSSHNASERDS